jgi:succinyl-CoA synthetase alpha subunit
MSILIGPDTRLVVQGITGREGEFHSRAMAEYGTRIVAGVTPGKGGQQALDSRVPVYDTVAEAVSREGANASCIFVPAAGAPDAVMEAASAGIATIFCITEGIPALDMIPAVALVQSLGARLIGPNCPGATSPGSAKVGIIPGSIHREGRVGVVSRSGTLTYEAVRETGANTSCIFVPAAGAPDAVMEAAAGGVSTIFCITEGIPALDMIPVVAFVAQAGARLIGPNCPGATSPGSAKVGIIPGSVHLEGGVGVVSRSGTLTYEAVQAMTDAGLGQSTCVGIGGDPIIGTTFLDVLQRFGADEATDAIVLIGEIGGAAEETAAAWAAGHLADIPKVAFIAGRTAPEGKRMGLAGANISGGAGTAASKVAALEAAGFLVAGSPTELPALLRDAGYQG